MTNKNSSEELLNLLKENIGKAYNQDSIESFESYIEELINSDTKQIASRISMLFAYWSNIEYLFGDKVEASWESTPEIILLKEYKFSIANDSFRITENGIDFAIFKNKAPLVFNPKFLAKRQNKTASQSLFDSFNN